MKIKKTNIKKMVNGYCFESWVRLEAEIYLQYGSNLNYAIETTTKYWDVDYETAKEELNKAVNELLPTTPP